jgi:hypothetical protein
VQQLNMNAKSKTEDCVEEQQHVTCIVVKHLNKQEKYTLQTNVTEDEQWT